MTFYLVIFTNIPAAARVHMMFNSALFHDNNNTGLDSNVSGDHVAG